MLKEKDITEGRIIQILRRNSRGGLTVTEL